MDNIYGLEEIHHKLLAGLIKLDRFCRENQIRYSLHGGTLLGAERNRRFIPWDDDADISMTRDAYEKFKTLLLSSRDPDVLLTEDALWIPRFVYRTDQEPVVIDVFVYDYITEHRLGAFLKINLLRFLQGMIKPKENLDFKNRSIAYRLLIGLSYAVGRLFPHSKKLDWYHDMETKRLLGKKRYIHRSNDSFYGLSYLFDSEFMSEYTDMELEGHTFMVNTRYREFLKRSYGEDYMTPPPDRERVPQHETLRNQIAGRARECTGERRAKGDEASSF